MAKKATTPKAPPLTALSKGPWATFVWGESRSVVNRVLYAMVSANDPESRWLEIRGPRDASPDPGPVELGWIPAGRLFVTSEPTEARPQKAVGNRALASVVRSDEPEHVVAQLTDFLRLPPIAQEVVGSLGFSQGRRVVGVANSDRVRSDYVNTPEGVRPVIEAFLAGQVLPFIGATSPPGQGRWAFEFVFEVRAHDLEHWKDGTLVPEKVVPGSGYTVGQPVRLNAIPEVARAFRS